MTSTRRHGAALVAIGLVAGAALAAQVLPSSAPRSAAPVAAGFSATPVRSALPEPGDDEFAERHPVWCCTY